MPSLAKGDDIIDYTEELVDDELLEDDEIDDDAAVSGKKSLSKSTESHWSAADEADYGSNSETEQDDTNIKGKGHGKDGREKSTQRRPPRPSRSASVGRKQKVQGGGSMHRRKTTRHRGTPSSPPITVRDIMGSEKKATAVGITHSGHSRPAVPASPMKGSKTGAEQKRSMIRSRWKEKQNRQCDVKNSLAQFLAVESQSEGSDQEFIIDAEDDEMISDVDDGEAQQQISSNSLELNGDDDTDDAKSIKSTKSTKSQRRRRGSTKRTDANVRDGDTRHRVKKSTGGGSDDKSVGGSTRRSSRHSPHPGGEGDGTARQRRCDDGGSVDGERTRSHRDVDGHKKTRSSSTRRKSTESNGVPAKPRSTRRTSHPDDDDRSVGSKKSVGGRRRRQQQLHRSKVSSSTDPPHTTKSTLTKKSPREPGPVSPLSSKPSSTSSLVEESDKLTLLARHIESNPKPRNLMDLEERSEESSRFSTNYDQPTSLLQFDPTNANNITLVKQDKADVRSERFRNADGTESEFHISTLAGLPTFEASSSNFHDSNFELSASELRPHSARSMGSVDCSSDDNMAKAAKSMSNIGYTSKKNGQSKKSGHKGEEGAVRNSRVVAKSNPAGRVRGVAASKSFQGSMKGLFGVWNKKGECETGEEDEDDQPKSNRFFRKREDLTHQVLDDDGSDEN